MTLNLSSSTPDWASPSAIGSVVPNTVTATRLTGQGGAVTANTPVLDLTQTWNNPGVTFTGLRFSVTDTASSAASLLADFQVGGVSRFNVSANGVLTVTPPSGSSNAFVTTARIAADGGVFGGFDSVLSTGLLLGNGRTVQWSSTPNWAGTKDLFLLRDGTGILAQANSTNPQAFRIYNTFTSATSHERGKLEWTSNEFRVGTEKGSGGGSARGMALQTDGITRLSFSAAGNMIFTSPAAPANASAAGVTGEIRIDADFIYVCTATNTWKRSALSTW